MTCRVLAAAAVLTVIAAPRTARAHDFNPGVLSLTETAPGLYDMAWTEPVDSRGSQAEVGVVFPSGCRASGARVQLPPRQPVRGRSLHRDPRAADEGRGRRPPALGPL